MVHALGGRPRTHHLHVVVHGAWHGGADCVSRCLRADPELARRYEALKRTLANTHRNDREAYTGAKSTLSQAAAA